MRTKKLNYSGNGVPWPFNAHRTRTIFQEEVTPRAGRETTSIPHLLVVVLRAARRHHPASSAPTARVGRVVAWVPGPLALPPVSSLAVRLEDN